MTLLYIVWATRSNTIEFIKSTDGGRSFSPTQPLPGVVNVRETHGPFTYRVAPLVTIAAGDNNNVLVAWADGENPSRIFLQRSTNGGSSWGSSQPLLPFEDPVVWRPRISLYPPRGQQHFDDFHPKLASFSGEIGCAFYRHTRTNNIELLEVLCASTLDGGDAWSVTTVSDSPWDPAVGAPKYSGDEYFIGDYLGLVGSDMGFHPFWTDTSLTRTQDIFTALVSYGPYYPVSWSTILRLIQQGGNGLRLVPEGLAPTDASGTDDMLGEERELRARCAFDELAESIRTLLQLGSEMTTQSGDRGK